MFTVKELGTTYAKAFGGVTGWVTGSSSLGVGVILLIPAINQVHSYKGVIDEGSKNKWGDRACFHFEADGDLYMPEYSDSIVSTVVDPCYSETQGYVGNRYTVEKRTLRFSNGTTSLCAGPVVTPGSHTLRFVYPDHERRGVAWYRNIVSVIEMTMTSCVSTLTYEVKYSQSGSWQQNTQSSVVDLDIPNRRWKLHSSSSWTTFLQLGNYGSKNTFSGHSSDIKPHEWSDAYYRISGQFMPVSDNRIFGDLCRRCANDARGIDTNGISLVREIATLADQVKDAHALLKGKKTLKNLSSIYLSYKYGMRLTASDVMKIVRERAHILKSMSNSKNWVRSKNGVSGTPIVLSFLSRYTLYTYKILYHTADDFGRRIISDWENSGLFPTLETSWDLIPYSFVVDWFSDMQASLQQYDATTYWSVHSIIGATAGMKDTFQGVPPWLLFPWLGNCLGSVSFKRYTRSPSESLILPSYFDDTPLDFKNFAELTALLIQRMSKK